MVDITEFSRYLGRSIGVDKQTSASELLVIIQCPQQVDWGRCGRCYWFDSLAVKKKKQEKKMQYTDSTQNVKKNVHL